MLIYFGVYLFICLVLLSVKPLSDEVKKFFPERIKDLKKIWKPETDILWFIDKANKKHDSKLFKIVKSILYVVVMLFTFIVFFYLLAPIHFIDQYRIKKKEKREENKKRKKQQDREAKYAGVELPNMEIITVPDHQLNLQSTQIFYFEDEYNVLINNYIQNNYEKIQAIFATETTEYKANRLEFIYIPKLTNHWLSFIPSFVDSMKYYYPNYTTTEIKTHIERIGNISTADFTKLVLNSLGYEGRIFAGLFRIQNDNKFGYHNFRFSYVELAADNETILEKLFWHYIYHIGSRRPDVLYKIETTEDLLARLKAEGRENEIADLLFDSHALEIAEEIKQKIASLQVSGYNQLLMNLVAQQLANPELLAAPKNNPLAIAPPKLSRLVITQDFKIFLPDFNNLEIVMTPLPKAIFLLFLQYPLGMLLKHLPDYQNQLFEIYKQISYRETPDEMLASIKDVTNPAKNSINEKCSRIKEAFIRHFDDSIAKHYYITGERGKRKYISLNRDLVEWE
jgi:hypothetical protein